MDFPKTLSPLSPQEQLEDSTQVRNWLALLKLKKSLALELRHSPTDSEWALAAGCLVEELEKKLIKSEASRERFIVRNLPFVASIAKRYYSKGLEFHDLLQEGCLGLVRAVEKFDPTKGYRFSTYAHWWIREAILRAIAKQSLIPKHLSEKLNRIQTSGRELAKKLGRTPTIKELSQATRVSPAQIRELLCQAQSSISLEEPIGDSTLTLKDSIPSSDCSPLDWLLRQERLEYAEQLLAELTAQEFNVISLLFGLDEEGELSFVEVGKHCGLSPQKVRQIELKVFRKLKINVINRQIKEICY